MGRDNFDDLKPRQTTGGSAGSGANTGGAAGSNGTAGTGVGGQGGTTGGSAGGMPDSSLDSDTGAGGTSGGTEGSDGQGGPGNSSDSGDGAAAGSDGSTDSSVSDVGTDAQTDGASDAGSADAHDAAPPFILNAQLLVTPTFDIVMNFGRSAAVDHNWSVVGAEDLTRTGVAYIAKQQPSKEWTIDTRLEPTGAPLPLANFGYSVAIARERVAVGAPGNASRPGQVYFYYLNADSQWVDMQLPVTATDPKPGDRFGHDVVAESNLLYVVIGAPGEADGRGAVYVYRDTPIHWYEAGKIVPPTVANNFGSKVSINGNTLAICSRPDAQSSQGAVWIYEFQAYPFVATQTQVLHPSSPNEEFYCDQAVALGPSFLLVGAKSPEGGVVYAYERYSGEWRELPQKISLPADATIAPGDFGINTVLCGGWVATGHRSRPSPGSDVFFEQLVLPGPEIVEFRHVGPLSQLAVGIDLNGMACQLGTFLVGDNAPGRGIWFLELEER